jgi:hypothetical protein
MFPRKYFVLVLGFAALSIVAVAAVRHYSWHYNWAMIQRATRLEALQDVSNLDITDGPSFANPLWSVVRFNIPAESVGEFVAKNQCAASDRTLFERYRSTLPRDVQTLPSSGKHFYKSGTTTSGRPFEILVDSGGLVIMYVMLDD